MRELGARLARRHGEALASTGDLARQRGLTLPDETSGGLLARDELEQLRAFGGAEFDKRYLPLLVGVQEEQLHRLVKLRRRLRDKDLVGFAERLESRMRRELRADRALLGGRTSARQRSAR